MSLVLVKEVRDRSGAPMVDCQKALVEGKNDVEKALEILQKKGIIKAGARGGKIATDGRITSYIHHSSKLGVILEVNCETDFCARSSEFIQFCDETAMQIAAMSSQFVKKEDVPEEYIVKQKDIFQAQMKDTNKPEASWAKIIEGKLNKHLAEICLVDQESIVQKGKTIEQLRIELAAKCGENISIRRFSRWELGEGIEKAKKENLAEEVKKLTEVNEMEVLTEKWKTLIK